MNRAKWMAWTLLAGFFSTAVLILGCMQQRRPTRYLIPKGYVGSVKVEYGVPGAPALPMEDGFYLVRFPPQGLVKTSSDIESGVARDEYYYYSGAKRERLNVTGWNEGGMIWGGTIALPPQSNIPELAKVSWKATLDFFVGTEVQWHEDGFQSTKPSKREKEFYDFGHACGMQDGSRGVDEFAEDVNRPPKPMVGGGKVQEYLATLSGGIPASEATRRARAKNPKMAIAYRLHSLLITARPYPQYLYIQAFKKGYGIAQLRHRIQRHSAVQREAH